MFWLATGYIVQSLAVKALRKVLSEPFISSTNGSRTGYLSLPASTLCSSICGTPVLFSGGVQKLIENVLFVSSQFRCTIVRPLLSCL